MRDFRKFSRPKVLKSIPNIGDVFVKLKCKSIVPVSAKDFNKIRRFFKIDSIVGEASQKTGNIKVFSNNLNKTFQLNPTDYNKIKDRVEFKEVVGAVSSPIDGNILVHNDILNIDSVFTFNDWVASDDTWTITGLQGITTYEEENASDGDYIIMANGTTLIISSSDYSKVSSNWEQVDTIQIPSDKPES